MELRTNRIAQGLVYALVGCLCAPLWAASTPEISLEQFRAELRNNRQIAAACSAVASACDATLVPEDAHVAKSATTPPFNQSWDWLRNSLTAEAKNTDADRQKATIALTERFDELEREISTSTSDVNFQRIRSQANTVLSKREFQDDTESSWWDKVKTRFWTFVSKIFGGLQNVGARNGWLWPLFEVLLYLAAAVGLLLIVRRSLARQRQAIALGTVAAKFRAWDKEAEDWTEQAERCAADEQWREAVHCLYWAAIVGLESQRAWRHNPTRTPREYVRLLKAGSAQQSALRGMTHLLERVWYGLRDATREDYESARTLFSGLHTKSSAEVA